MLSSAPPEHQKPLHKIPLYPFREILIGGPKYAHIALKTHSLNDLTEFPFISLGNDTSTRELFNRYFLNLKIPFHPDMEAATTDQILPMVKHNLGLGFYPEELAAEALSRGEITQIPLVEPIPERQVCLIRNTNRPQSIAAKSWRKLCCITPGASADKSRMPKSDNASAGNMPEIYKMGATAHNTGSFPAQAGGRAARYGHFPYGRRFCGPAEASERDAPFLFRDVDRSQHRLRFLRFRNIINRNN